MFVPLVWIATVCVVFYLFANIVMRVWNKSLRHAVGASELSIQQSLLLIVVVQLVVFPFHVATYIGTPIASLLLTAGWY